jgi:protein-tyrosine phosphatase
MALRKLISGDKYRLKEGNYDFDLTYITQNIIAMGIPGENISTVWRNDSNEVSKFLNKKHGKHYLIFNLSGDKYDYKPYNYQVKDFGFPDHHAPPVTLLVKIVEEMFSWLSKDQNNVVAVHCLAGRSRTGTVIAALLLYGGWTRSADEAIRFFNSQRSQNENGVVLPSQIRYVNYFEQMMQASSIERVTHSPQKVFLKEIVIEPVPAVEGGGKRSSTGGAFTPILKIEELEEPQRQIKRLTFPSFWKSDQRVRLEVNTELQGDIQIKFVHFSKNPKAFTKTVRRVFNSTLLQAKVTSQYPNVTLFRFTFHTSFVANNAHLVLSASDLDAAYAGSIVGQSYIPDNLQVHFFFAPSGSSAATSGGSNSPSRTRSNTQYTTPSRPANPVSVSPNINQMRSNIATSITVSRTNLPISTYATTDVINVTRDTPMSLPPNTSMRRMSDPVPYSPSMVPANHVNNPVIPTANQFPTAFTMNQPNTMSFNPSMNPVTPSFPNTLQFGAPNMNNNINNITNSMGNMNLNSMSVPSMNYNNPVNTPTMPYNPNPGFNSFNPVMGPSVTYNTHPSMLPIYTPPNITPGPAFPMPSSNPSFPMPTTGSVLPQPSYPGYPTNPYPF